MGYRKYTEEFKREVLTMAAEGSRNVAQLECKLDITPGLIFKWQQRYRVKDEPYVACWRETRSSSACAMSGAATTMPCRRASGAP